MMTEPAVNERCSSLAEKAEGETWKEGWGKRKKKIGSNETVGECLKGYVVGRSRR